LVSAVSLAAQSQADHIAVLERERVAALRAGRNIASFYTRAYVGINADGSTHNFEQISQGVEGPVIRLDDAFTVRVYRVAALVTGVEWIGAPPVAHRFLRVWVGSGGDEWKIAVSQHTAISGGTVANRSSERSAVGPMRASNPPCHGIRGALDADVQRDEALRQRNVDAYATLVAPEFVHVDGAGRTLNRGDFLHALLSTAPERVARGRQFKACDLAVLFLRGQVPSGVDGRDLIELEVRVLANVGGVWRQVAAQRTPVSDTFGWQRDFPMGFR
jgi:hypothetical protein